jgi:2-polyprenyl-3-methyl-5-hydroxy-6-metoxy-1,4-benzoquinol methylase
VLEIKDDYLKYLSGRMFHNGLDFPIYDNSIIETVVTDRFTLLEELCSGKSVLHIGCADHINLIDAKRSAGTWIHGYLTKISSKCIGIDINREAVNYLQNHLGITNVIYANITEEFPESLNESSPWNKVFLGEIIEHVNNPVNFLKKLKKGLNGHAEELILTAPNALSLQNFNNLRKGVECINSDHRYWFTPYTLAKIVQEATFKPKSFYFVTSYKPSKLIGIRNTIYYHCLLRFPGLRDTIVLRADF